MGTEMGSATHLAEVASSKYGSVGKLLPGMMCKIIDPEAGEISQPGQTGELCLKGPNMMTGYCHDHHGEATADIIDRDGYLHTGDIAYVDEDGNFFIVDRLKDLIKVQGYQVAPAEIEAVLAACPGVEDAGVIGVPAKRAGDGQVPKAFVVKSPGSKLTQADVKEFVAARMVAHKCVAGVEFVEALPKNNMLSKIMRKELRRMAGETFA